MRVGVFQFAPRFGEINYNLDQIEAVLMKTDMDLVVLPELCTTGYQFVSKEETLSFCESVPKGESVQRFEKICAAKKMFIVAGLGEKVGDVCYNSSVLVGPEGLIGVYRKIHLFDQEKLWFQTGADGFKVWDIGIARVGMMICFDWIFPESARSLALMGADIICHPANLVLPYCPDAMITRSIENRVFTATANRIGLEERVPGSALTYIGRSQITDPKGTRLLQFGPDEENIGSVEIDVTSAREKRITKLNDLWEDRRTEFYGH